MIGKTNAQAASATKETYVYDASVSITSSITVNCGFSSKAGTVKVYGYNSLLGRGKAIYNNLELNADGSTYATITATDNLDGTVTIATTGGFAIVKLAIIKTLT